MTIQFLRNPSKQPGKRLELKVRPKPLEVTWKPVRAVFVFESNLISPSFPSAGQETEREREGARPRRFLGRAAVVDAEEGFHRDHVRRSTDKQLILCT